MKLDTEQPSDNLIIVRISSENLDASNVKDFRKTIDPFLENHSRVVLDLEELNFVDSSGLGAMIACLRKVTTDDRELVLCNVSDPVQALFDLMRLHKVFVVHATREEAVRGASQVS